ncbi:cytochrome c family protein [Altererythrobacter sp. KTW20L]|uniref:cytochrome c family protein n=1 Tax=Altererythrobacter sp. KTW20L TaxID=2942210 RepID=UPI0020C151AF|nr:cytochrome c family protein [Altererythrobacter sp. KTW20L]MCL6251490.1 cytochrome c family protein [Altererythrobacter sp. KTW20L]
MTKRDARTGTAARPGLARLLSPRAILSALSGLALVAGGLFIGLPQDSSAQAQGGYSYTGVATCAGSTCHGRSEGNGAVVRQDEIATWQSPFAVSGAHSRAYAVLSGRRGQQIAQSLGWDDATSRGECLGCHATYVPASDRGPRFQVTDGVGCESCHGPAAGWLASHYEVGGTHAANISRGMVALDQPQVRAGVCLDCHYGSEKEGQFVTHAMMAAGHPRISFELDLFSSFQQHHDVDADYMARKGVADGVQLWAVGQAEAVARATDLFTNPRLATEGLFPQLTFFDCHSCHRQITDGAERRLTFEVNPGRPIIFGQPPFNDENVIMLDAVATALAPARAEGFRSASREFHAAMNRGREPAVAAAATLNAEAQRLSDALAARSYGGNDAFEVVAIIGGRATSSRFTDYAGSAQAVMAVDTLLNSLVTQGRITVGAAASIRADINRAYAAVRSPESYNPGDFRAALGQAVGAIGRLR